jgi:hypothetical protein
LRYYDNLEYQTIAETMGLSLGNVKTLDPSRQAGPSARRCASAKRKRSKPCPPNAPPFPEFHMRCSSFEPLLDEYVDGVLAPREHALVAAHVAGCASRAGLLEELRVIDALLLTPRALEPAPNFTFKVMAEVRSLPAPAVHHVPTLP